MIIACVTSGMAQYTTGTHEGSLNDEVRWMFDGKTLTLTNITKPMRKANIPDYDLANQAPWIKKKLPVKSVRIGKGIERLGSCAFANCTYLSEVEFEGTSVKEIGWGAFLNCKRLRTFSVPATVRKIETIAFAYCSSLQSIKIPDQCIVEDQAFVNTEAKDLEISPTATIGHYVFASEIKRGGKPRHTLYNGEIRRLPAYVNSHTCHTYGLSPEAVSLYRSGSSASNANEDYDYRTSELDSIDVTATAVNSQSYALIIGNQNYRFVDKVDYAIHDARVFKEYCEKMLGIPSENIHIVEDGTKAMINEEEFQWLESISNRDSKKLILYYAGHGVPDIKDSNKSYMLPVDIRGSKPENGIALDDFYRRIGDLDFAQTAIFLDACFSGMKRDDKSVNSGDRATRIEAKEGTISAGNIVVFAAAQGNETAQGYSSQGHGLFTYYLLDGLYKYRNSINFGMLSNHIREGVVKTSQEKNHPQNPKTQPSSNIADRWQLMKF